MPQDAAEPFGALDWRRIGGAVLELPPWDVTEQHRSAAAALSTGDGVLAELRAVGPTVAGLTLLILLLRWALTRLVLVPLGERLVPPSAAPGRRQKTLARFQAAAWEALWYSCSSGFGLHVYQQERWSVWPTTNFWIEWPLQDFGPPFRLYYEISLAFYLSALLSLLLLDAPRSDFVQYLLHHLVTIFLIAVSFYTRIQRYGLVILLLHDVGAYPSSCSRLLTSEEAIISRLRFVEQAMSS